MRFLQLKNGRVLCLENAEVRVEVPKASKVLPRVGQVGFPEVGDVKVTPD